LSEQQNTNSQTVDRRHTEKRTTSLSVHTRFRCDRKSGRMAQLLERNVDEWLNCLNETKVAEKLKDRYQPAENTERTKEAFEWNRQLYDEKGCSIRLLYDRKKYKKRIV